MFDSVCLGFSQGKLLSFYCIAPFWQSSIIQRPAHDLQHFSPIYTSYLSLLFPFSSPKVATLKALRQQSGEEHSNSSTNPLLYPPSASSRLELLSLSLKGAFSFNMWHGSHVNIIVKDWTPLFSGYRNDILNITCLLASTHKKENKWTRGRTQTFLFD